MAKILLVETDIHARRGLHSLFRGSNHVVDLCASCEEALLFLEQFDYELVVFSAEDASMSAAGFCSCYRAGGGRAMLLVLSERQDLQAGLLCLDAGADDYMRKPYDDSELLARVRAMLRRPVPPANKPYSAAGISFHQSERIVVVGNVQIQLSTREFELLQYLGRHAYRTLSSRELLNAVWPDAENHSIDTVRSCMYLLRRKLAKCGLATLVGTDREGGYVLQPASALVVPTATGSIEATAVSHDSNVQPI